VASSKVTQDTPAETVLIMMPFFSMALLLLLIQATKILVCAAHYNGTTGLPRIQDRNGRPAHVPDPIQYPVLFTGNESQDVLLDSFNDQLQANPLTWEDLAPLVCIYREYHCEDTKLAYFRLLERSGRPPEVLSLEYFLYVLFYEEEAITPILTSKRMLMLMNDLKPGNRTYLGFKSITKAINDRVVPIHYFDSEMYKLCKTILADNLQINELAIVLSGPTLFHILLGLINLLFASISRFIKPLLLFFLLLLMIIPLVIEKVSFILMSLFEILNDNLPLPRARASIIGLFKTSLL
jgi:hypothetical protein